MARWNPDDYRRNSAAQQKWARELLGKLALRGDECVLDIGSGDGKVTAELASLVPHGQVVGVDNSAEMVAFARAQFPAASCANFSFEMLDARALRFTEEFDVVFSNATLHWIVDHRPVLAGVARALKRGGRVLFQMGGRGNAAALVRVLDDFLARPEWRGYFADFASPYGFHDPVQYRAWLATAGLEPARVELLPKDMVHRGAEGLAGWFRTTWMPYTARVPDGLRDRFVAQVIETYVAAHPPDGEGGVHTAMVRLEVEAIRKEGESGHA